MGARASSKMVLEIGYWAIRGLGAPCRMAAHYAGADCKFNNYGVTATDDGWDKSSWFDVKPQFKEQNGLINLPYVIDNGFVVTQTNAVLMYLGRKFGLIGSTAQQTSIV